MSLDGYLAEPLRSTGEWFERVLHACRPEMRCGRGCTLCCHGLFDIALPEALLLAHGLSWLSARDLSDVRARSAAVQSAIESAAPELRSPFLLHDLSEQRVDEIVRALDAPRCPLLTDDGACSVYDLRPLACRLEGVPMVDSADGPFGDWCELNFTGGVPEPAIEILRRDYDTLQRLEEEATAEASELPLGRRLAWVTVFIPSVVDAFEDYWRPVLHRRQAGTSDAA